VYICSIGVPCFVRSPRVEYDPINREHCSQGVCTMSTKEEEKYEKYCAQYLLNGENNDNDNDDEYCVCCGAQLLAGDGQNICNICDDDEDY